MPKRFADEPDPFVAKRPYLEVDADDEAVIKKFLAKKRREANEIVKGLMSCPPSAAVVAPKVLPSSSPSAAVVAPKLWGHLHRLQLLHRRSCRHLHRLQSQRISGKMRRFSYSRSRRRFSISGKMSSKLHRKHCRHLHRHRHHMHPHHGCKQLLSRCLHRLKHRHRLHRHHGCIQAHRARLHRPCLHCHLLHRCKRHRCKRRKGRGKEAVPSESSLQPSSTGLLRLARRTSGMATIGWIETFGRVRTTVKVGIRIFRSGTDVLIAFC